ncbi:hypothetical protein JHK85_045773 [Glycine max]|nr:hypothetical protein JHK85_045773 [Glycine max]
MDTSTDKSTKKEINSDSVICSAGTLERFPPNITESLLTSTDSVSIDDLSIQPDHELPYDNNGRKTPILDNITSSITKCMGYVKVETVFTPSTIAVIIGFAIGAISPIKKLVVGDSAPFRVIISSASLVGLDPIWLEEIEGPSLEQNHKGSQLCGIIAMLKREIRCTL